MKKLFDNHGREINYLRLAVTDRCNLRCFYCMPEEGIKYVPQKDLLSYEEMLRICSLLAKMGIKKVRITGGEPFVRRNLEYFIRELNKIDGIEQIHLTTNGTITQHLIPHFREMGIKSVNLSLDSLDRDRFFEITRRDEFPKVMASLDALIESGIKTKINAVVMDGKNIDDILPMVEMTRNKPISVRFIEEMPFNGEGAKYPHLNWNYKQIIEHIKTQYPTLEKLPDPPFSTSYNYQIPGFAGSVGVIAAYTRTFCGTCNRIRLTPKGVLKTCLYDDGVFNLKTFIREGATDKQLEDLFLNALGNRAKDGYEAEKRRNFGSPITESMSTIGG
ncbi:MAG: GTP 3',8-cyclase MoaA [Bacteroidota bacterium]